MPSLAIAALTFIAALASGLAGFALARALPEAQTTERSRLLLAGASALIGLLLAATLGLTIADAHGAAQARQAAAQRLAAQALQFDLTLKAYGPAAAEARRMLGAELALADRQMRNGAGALDATAANIAAMLTFLNGMKPADDAGRQELAAAERLYEDIAAARLRLSLPLPDPVSWPLTLTLISWSCLLFCGLGALSRANPTTIAALAVGAAVVASAIFLAIELSQPYFSAFRPSPKLIEQTLMEIAQ